jgi:hypothetical protein
MKSYWLMSVVRAKDAIKMTPVNMLRQLAHSDQIFPATEVVTAGFAHGHPQQIPENPATPRGTIGRAAAGYSTHRPRAAEALWPLNGCLGIPNTDQSPRPIPGNGRRTRLAGAGIGSLHRGVVTGHALKRDCP